MPAVTTNSDVTDPFAKKWNLDDPKDCTMDIKATERDPGFTRFEVSISTSEPFMDLWD